MEPSKIGFFSLSRELRDLIYDYWGDSARSIVQRHGDYPQIPFEDTTREPRFFAASGWRLTGHIAYPQALAVCKQLRHELLERHLGFSRLVITGLCVAIDEDLVAPQLEQLRVPPSILNYAGHIDLCVELIPRYQLFRSHTVESQISRLCTTGKNRYVGIPSQLHNEPDFFAHQRFGVEHAMLRTPERVTRRYAERIRLLDEMVTAKLEDEMESPDPRPFDASLMHYYTRAYLLSQWDRSIPGGRRRRAAIVEAVKAMKVGWNVSLPPADRLRWIMRAAESFPDIANMAREILWDDCATGMKAVAEGLRSTSEAIASQNRIRLFLRVKNDDILTTVDHALKELITKCPELTQIKNLECISLTSRTNNRDPIHSSHFEQWTSNEAVGRGAGLAALLKESGATQPRGGRSQISQEGMLGGVFEVLEGYHLDPYAPAALGDQPNPGHFQAVREFEQAVHLLEDFHNWPNLSGTIRGPAFDMRLPQQKKWSSLMSERSWDAEAADGIPEPDDTVIRELRVADQEFTIRRGQRLRELGGQTQDVYDLMNRNSAATQFAGAAFTRPSPFSRSSPFTDI